MLTALGAIFGFLGSLAPELLKLYTAKEDRKHELALVDRQAELTKLGLNAKLEEVNINADVQDMANVYQQSQVGVPDTGIKWVDAILETVNALVRPTITYIYFGLYLVIKYANYTIMKTQQTLDWKAAIVANWNDFDSAMLAAILGFWFGNRMIQKYIKMGK
jgi:uncharacterized membrane protein YvlD (DUF360 family)